MTIMRSKRRARKHKFDRAALLLSCGGQGFAQSLQVQAAEWGLAERTSKIKMFGQLRDRDLNHAAAALRMPAMNPDRMQLRRKQL